MKRVKFLIFAFSFLFMLPVNGARLKFNNGKSHLDFLYLLQSWFTMAKDGAPDGSSWGKDFYIRRSRFLIAGKLCKKINFFMETDNPNFGKDGNWSGSMFTQDAYLEFDYGKSFKVMTGLLLLPFSHHATQGAVSLNTLDYHGWLIKYPNGSTKVWRDAGIMARGLVLNDKLEYRFGVFNGIEGNSSSSPVLNETDMPRFTGRLQFNLFDAEEKFFKSGIYFGKKKIVSFGVGFDFQPDAVINGSGNVDKYYAFSGDIFVDYPITVGEVVFQAAYHKYFYGEDNSNNGWGLFAEGGFRYKKIEPVVSYEMFNFEGTSDNNGVDNITKILFGLNYWIKGHLVNVKAQFGMEKYGSSDYTYTGIFQAQLLFK